MFYKKNDIKLKNNCLFLWTSPVMKENQAKMKSFKSNFTKRGGESTSAKKKIAILNKKYQEITLSSSVSE